MPIRRAISVRIVSESAQTGEANFHLRLNELFPNPEGIDGFLLRLADEVQAFGVVVTPQSLRLSPVDTLADAVERVYEALPEGDGAGPPAPPDSIPDFESEMQRASQVEGSGWRKEGLVYFLAAALLAVILTAAWPRSHEPVPDLPQPTAVAVSLKPGGLLPPEILPACVVVVLSPTGSSTESPAIFSRAWLIGVRNLSDRTWADLTLSRSDAEELAKQLSKYDVQILKPVNRYDCLGDAGSSGSTGADVGSPPSTGTTGFPLLFWLTYLVLAAVGGVMIFAGKTKATRVGGLALLATGLLGHVALVKEFKIDKIIGIENLLKIGDPRLSLVIKREIQASGAKLEYLGDWPDFPIGGASIDLTAGRAKATRDAVISKWRSHRQEGILLVVGSADRLPLRGAYAGQYDANVGLARARAEFIKDQLVELTKNSSYPIEKEQVLSLVSGPAQTPDRRHIEEERRGYPGDRRVEIWAFWSSAPAN
jgi:hypothetical protein